MTIDVVITGIDEYSEGKTAKGLSIAADSMLSSGMRYGVPVDKISLHENNTVLAYSGELTLGQELANIIELNKNLCNYQNEYVYPQKISQAAIQYFSQATNVSPVSDLTFIQNRYSPWSISAIMGYVNNDSIYSCIFDSRMRPTVLDRNLFYNTIGSGTDTARPFLQWIIRKLLKNVTPSVNDSSFLAYWAIRHTIETSGGGVGYPIKICEIRRDPDGTINSRMLSEQEIQIHDTSANILEKDIGYLLSNLF